MFRLTYSASPSSYLIIIRILFIIIIFLGSNLFQFATTKSGYDNCGTIGQFSCGNGVTLQYPFWSMVEKEQRYYCGYPGFGITCNLTDGKPVLNISNQLYYVIGTDQFSKQLTIVHTDLFKQDCPLPRKNFTNDQNLSSRSLFRLKREDYNTQLTFFLGCGTPPPQTRNVTTLNMIGSNSINCLSYSQTKNSYGFLDFNLNMSERKSLAGWSQNSCSVSVIVPVQNSDYTHVYENLILYTYILRSGFQIRWVTPIECQKCEKSGGYCSYNETERTYTCWCGKGQLIRNGADRKEYYCSWHSGIFHADTLPADTLFDGTLPADTSMHNKILIIGESLNSFLNHYNVPYLNSILEDLQQPKCRGLYTIGICSGFGGLASLMILLLFIYRNNQRKRIGSIAKNVELFLESYGYRSLQRYKYKDIKKMTNSFKDKLGQGGYGSVYKGKLIDGRLVAVKVLINDPKKSTNGEDFMNEVATIGRTNHVNIVALLGFCSSGSKRALVYEFMTNGSLEKFIYAEKEKKIITSTSSNEVNSTSSIQVHALGLGWEKLYQIAVGIARGLEYLHRGCNTGRILHFDIKPHNILLDENFCPKISDFGMAKLCPTRDSIVSMLSGGRGTIGYIAPEVYNRNFGGVSYKSDVYSYGMMVLEMVGGRKNIDPFVENTSEIYFPHWIYNHLEKDQDKIEGLLKFEAAFDQEMAMKMIMVGLWCIQTYQGSRPSMGRVAEMLEGSVKDLQVPPNPFVDPSLHPPPTS